MRTLNLFAALALPAPHLAQQGAALALSAECVRAIGDSLAATHALAPDLAGDSAFTFVVARRDTSGVPHRVELAPGDTVVYLVVKEASHASR